MPPHSDLPPVPLPPAQRAPAGACDTHVHLLAAPEEFPLWEGRSEDPADETNFAAYLTRYIGHLENLGIERGVIVHSILYGPDNSVTVEAVRRMGPNFRGIGLLPDGAPDKDLDRFVDWNLAGVRLNYVHGGLLSWDGARAMAPRLAERGLHIQMLCHSHLHMTDLAPDIAGLPVPVVFDHIAWPDLSLGVADPGFQTLLRLVGEGRAMVKLSGLYRLCDAPYDAADAHVAALVAANPDGCLWGSDWPHIMLNGATMPRAEDLWAAFLRAVPDAAIRQRILVDAPARLYGF